MRDLGEIPGTEIFHAWYGAAVLAVVQELTVLREEDHCVLYSWPLDRSSFVFVFGAMSEHTGTGQLQRA